MFVADRKKRSVFSCQTRTTEKLPDIADNDQAFTKYGHLLLVLPRTAAKLKNKCSCYEQMFN